MKKDDIRLTPISNGTVLDHLPAGTALRVLEILDLHNFDGAVTIAINTESKKMGRKDLVFIEGRELSKKEIDKISLLAQGATLNIIRKSEVAKKEKIQLPNFVEGVLQCQNPICITNHEKIPTKFFVSSFPLQAKCFYCENRMNDKEIAKAIK
jgi:aspartate carbamoyltransferase regulatory subunit